MVKNKRITFLIKTVSTNEYGQQKEEWIDSEKSALAAVSTLQERTETGQAILAEKDTLLFKVNFLSWMKELNKIDYRILYDGNTYDIKLINNVKERNRELQIKGVSLR